VSRVSKRLALAGLDADAVADLVDLLAGQDVAAAEADLVCAALHAETGGNPCFQRGTRYSWKRALGSSRRRVVTAGRHG
jgi:hypothetical protein